MIQTNWRDRPFNLRRIVLRDDLPTLYESTFRGLAETLSIDVGLDAGEAHTGDLWVGCYPTSNGEEADSEQVHWVSPLEIPIAQAWLNQLVRDRLVSDPEEEAPLLLRNNADSFPSGGVAVSQYRARVSHR